MHTLNHDLTSIVSIVKAFKYGLPIKSSYVLEIAVVGIIKYVPSIAENRISADITGYNSTHNDMDVSFPSSCNVSSKT